jgi:CheY-like chemotaxis protein
MKLWNKRVFYIEDNAANSGVIATLLQLEGAKVGRDTWGTRWYERLRIFTPVDLILLDLNLPNGLSGYDVYEQIRQHHEFDKVPVVIVSANDPEIEMPIARARGLDGYIPKPLSGNFPNLVAHVIKGNKVWGDID